MGFTLDELVGNPEATPKRKKSIAKPKKASPPKYAHPENPAMTWTGKGRQPNWFKEALDAGKTADDLLIK
jgi:DNA-binding protein H-NS